jgi:predicted naringenin-chalcone synthase
MSHTDATSLRIRGLGLATPTHDAAQSQLATSTELRCATNDRQRGKVQRIFAGTTVQRRGSVLLANGEARDPADRLGDAYPPSAGAADGGPTVAQRMAWYEERALPMAADAAGRALDDAGVTPQDIAQVVIVSCTGFAAPGLDVRLIDAIGLRPTVGRTMVGFMGCHGALNGLRVAEALAKTRPGEAVLLCCVELCTIHFQYGYDAQHIVANALFADGAAALVAQCPREAAYAQPQPRLIDQTSTIVPDSADAMTWRIRDHGFRMTLSPRVPTLVEQHLRTFVEPWLAQHGLTAKDVAGWVIHPGGPRVITAVESALGLPTGAGDASRAVLAAHGNMSSPTVLFILRRLIEQDTRGPVVMLAFGPGLVIEAALWSVGRVERRDP